MKMALNGGSFEAKHYIEKNYISKDKITAKIEELIDILDFVKTADDNKSKVQSEILQKIIEDLQKLLEE